MKKRILTIFTACLFAFALIGCNELKDPRDGKKYGIVKIGGQVWMAENLNYKMNDSYCFQDTPSNCKKYGRLYTWNAALEACPTGWHLPSKAEFETLFSAVGGSENAGEKLKSKTGWNVGCNGSDTFGFSALPAGSRHSYGDYIEKGLSAKFWSSTEYDSEIAYVMWLEYKDKFATHIDLFKNKGFSVRCLQN